MISVWQRHDDNYFVKYLNRWSVSHESFILVYNLKYFSEINNSKTKDDLV